MPEPECLAIDHKVDQWLRGMLRFCVDLKQFLHDLPTQVDQQYLQTVCADESHPLHDAYHELSRFSRKCVYMECIPTQAYAGLLHEVCIEAQQTWHLLGNLNKLWIFKSNNDGVSDSCTGSDRPFFERGLFVSMTLAVEHGIYLPTCVDHTRIVPVQPISCGECRRRR
jgi:hypothetical protein